MHFTISNYFSVGIMQTVHPLHVILGILYYWEIYKTNRSFSFHWLICERSSFHKCITFQHLSRIFFRFLLRCSK